MIHTQTQSLCIVLAIKRKEFSKMGTILILLPAHFFYMHVYLTSFVKFLLLLLLQFVVVQLLFCFHLPIITIIIYSFVSCTLLAIYSLRLGLLLFFIIQLHVCFCVLIDCNVIVYITSVLPVSHFVFSPSL